MKDERFTSIHWTHRTFTVDGETYEVTLLTHWYVPLWLYWLWCKPGLIRKARAKTLAKQSVPGSKPLREFASARIHKDKDKK